eukprot:jgi/Ulvmu1/7543/UM037_0087.1
MDREDEGLVIPSVNSDSVTGDDPKIWDLIVVGAGVAGSALAHTQGQAGRRVLVLEKCLDQPDRIVGELLQPGGYLMLKKMNLEACTVDIDAQEVYGYALFKGGKSVCVKYPTEGFANDVHGRSFHHGRFVQKLRHAAAAHPSVCMRQGVAVTLLRSDAAEWTEMSDCPVGGVRYKTADGVVRDAFAHLTVACDGMYSMLRKALHAGTTQKTSTFVGLIIKNPQLPFRNHGHVILGDPSPILVYPISSTEARVLIDIPPSAKMPSASSGQLRDYLLQRVHPQLPVELQECFVKAVANSKLRSMQNKQLAAQPLHPPGALLLGDSFNMRHPLTGGGMTVALADTKLLCDMLRTLPDFTDSVQTAKCTSDFYIKRKPLSSTINTLANALYEVFRQKEQEAHEEMRQAAFDYLSLGGNHSSGPVALLSGLNPQPSSLVAHFFMVALFGMGRLPLRKGLYGVWLSIMLLLVAIKIILPIITAEGIRAVFFPATAPQPYLKRLEKVQSLAPISTEENITLQAEHS